MQAPIKKRRRSWSATFRPGCGCGCGRCTDKLLQISYSTLSAWIASNLLILLVRMKGLEPSHPCEYMDLNHARLPIPPHPHVCTTGRKLYLFKPRTRSQPFAIPTALN